MILLPGKPTAADLGAMIALRHIEDAARVADPRDSLLKIVQAARDSLIAEIETNERAGETSK